MPETAQGSSTMDEVAKEEKVSSYVVLGAFGSDAGFLVVDTVVIRGNGGQREARKRAYETSKRVREAVAQGEEVFLAAVPASSWKPQLVKLEQREPRLLV